MEIMRFNLNIRLHFSNNKNIYYCYILITNLVVIILFSDDTQGKYSISSLH